ncbi:hypothetical protein CR513_20790, partial [Mucuna pruriens]
MIDAASGGALMDKTPATTGHQISNMASNTQQFETRRAATSWMVNKVGAIDNLRLENQLAELTSLVRQLVAGQHKPSVAARACGICTSVEHPTGMCHTLQETESDHPESVGSIVSLRSGRELPQRATPQQRLILADAKSEPEVDSQMPQQARSIPLLFPT